MALTLQDMREGASDKVAEQVVDGWKKLVERLRRGRNQIPDVKEVEEALPEVSDMKWMKKQ